MRLAEIEAEAATIRRAFPDLGPSNRRRSKTGLSGFDSSKVASSSKLGLSIAARKAISSRMKKYWAERRKGA